MYRAIWGDEMVITENRLAFTTTRPDPYDDPGDVDRGGHYEVHHTITVTGSDLVVTVEADDEFQTTTGSVPVPIATDRDETIDYLDALVKEKVEELSRLITLLYNVKKTTSFTLGLPKPGDAEQFDSDDRSA